MMAPPERSSTPVEGHDPDSPSKALLGTRTSELRLQAVLSGWRDLRRARHSNLAAAIFRRHHNSHRILTARLACPRDAVRLLAGSHHGVLVDRDPQLEWASSASGRVFGDPGFGMDRRSLGCLRFRD